MRKIVLFLVGLLASSLSAVLAQIPREPAAVKSPNAASLGLYGEVPVSHYTGLPTIQLPLYTLQQGATSLPVSLSYHASGFRPDEHPGWVGMGWSLNAGGVISRTVNDMADETAYTPSEVPSFPQLVHCGVYRQNPSLLSDPGWNQPNGLYNFTHPAICYGDTEPDEFSFNVQGHSGKFYRGHNNNWLVKSDEPIKVEVNAAPLLTVPFTPPPNSDADRPPMQGYRQTFSGFTLTIGDGTQYVFGATRDAIEYSLGFFDQLKDDWVATSWYLTAIIPVKGPQVTFTYSAGDFISQMYLSVYLVRRQSGLAHSGTVSPTSCVSCYSSGSFNIFNCGNCLNLIPTYTNIGCATLRPAVMPKEFYGGKLVRPVYLQSITSGDTHISFTRAESTELRYPLSTYQYRLDNGYTSQGLPFLPTGITGYTSDPMFAPLKWAKLESIAISHGSTPIKSFTLDYTNDLSQRLTLLSVQEKGANNGLKPPYTFTYHDLANLPPYFSQKTDHWGFFNDIEAPLNNLEFRYGMYVNGDPNYHTNYYTRRQPNSSPAVYLKGLLTQITYPTGGVTAFTYEPHTYSKVVTADRSGVTPLTGHAGGVRIKKITSVPPESPNQKLEKEYFYVSGVYTSGTNPSTLNSSGTLGGQAQYFFTDYELLLRGAGGNANSLVGFSRDIFSSQSGLQAAGNGHGSHIGYGQVIEKRTDGGYSVYNYSTYEDGEPDLAGETINPDRTLYQPFTAREQERGHLLRERHYTHTDKLVKDRVLTYAPLPNRTLAARAVKATLFEVCPEVENRNSPTGQGTGVYIGEATAYTFPVYSMLPVSETETIYDENGLHPLVTTRTTSYNAHKLPTTTTSTSGTKTRSTQIKYAPDILAAATGNLNSSDVAAGLVAMAGPKHMVALPLEITQSVDNHVVEARFTTYRRQFFGTTINATIVPDQVSTLETTQPLAPSAYTAPHWSATGLGLDAKLKPTLTFNAYDAQGNALALTKPGQVYTGYAWGYGQTLSVMQVSNAICGPPDVADMTIGNEASYLGFESGVATVGTDPNEDYWGMHTSTLNQMVATAHTGEWAWQVGGAGSYWNYGPGRVFSPERQTQRYKLSAWVKTDASFGANDGRLVLAVRRANGSPATAAQCYEVASFGPTNGEWRYVEVFLDLPGAHTSLASLGVPLTERLQVVAYSYNAGSQPYVIDDIRFQPAESAMTTYTYRPLIGVRTLSDENSRPTYYEYDEFQRLQLVKDHQGNVLTAHDYHYRP